MNTNDALLWLRAAAPELEFLAAKQKLAGSRFACVVRFAAGNQTVQFHCEFGGPEGIPDEALLQKEIEIIRARVASYTACARQGSEVVA